MGMFAKDKEIGRQLTDVFDYGDEFILWKVEVKPKSVDTRLGKADKTNLRVSRLADPTNRFDVSTLASAIAAKAKEATQDDFPCIVSLLLVNSSVAGGQKATVLQFVGEFDGAGNQAEDDIPF